MESIQTTDNTRLFRTGTSGFLRRDVAAMPSTRELGDRWYGYAGNAENAGAILSIPLGHGYAWDETASTDYTTLGGWMQDTFFIARIDRTGVTSEHGLPSGMTENVGVFGNRTGTAPTADSLSTSLSGRAHWTGAMVGVDKRASNNPRFGRGIVGRSSLILDFDTNSAGLLQVKIFDMVDTVEGKPYSDIVWDGVTIDTDGVFKVEDNNNDPVLWGTFYGADHREAGGVFHENNNLVGSFGATRDPVLEDATD